MTQANQPSEFGGYAGTIQPEPHELTPAEEARLLRKMDPSSTSDTLDAARKREVEGE